jgi:dTDP-4-dehydrorhamnose 3,5-epimerase
MGLNELIELEPVVHRDLRGFFLESYHQIRYQELGVNVSFCQDNHSYSKKGVLRGMHFQVGQAKLIYCPKGEIFDVAVDIRKGSPTFGSWKGFYLSEGNHKQLFIPDGFAHGFCVLSDEAHVMYKISTFFNKDLERGFSPVDPSVGIKWPVQLPILSERDAKAPLFVEVV